MKIDIDYNGALAVCKVNNKYFQECDNLTKTRVFSAFRCIKQQFDRDCKNDKTNNNYDTRR